MVDLSGLRFGRLLAISPTDDRKKNCVVWHCQCDCGNTYEASSALLLNGHVSSCGCIGCSKGENKIEDLLQLTGKKYEKEKSFSTCRSDNGTLYRFDFYVENKYLIEFDGQQHYVSTSGWNTKEQLALTQKRDQEKNQWCVENKQTLIRIPYYHLNELKIEDLNIETSEFIVIKEGELVC